MGEPNLPIAQLEQRKGLPRGTLASPLKPANRGRLPRLPTIQTFACALNLDINTVGKAFLADYLGDDDEQTVHQQRAADLIGELPPPLQRLAVRQLEVLVEHFRECRANIAPSQDADADTLST